MLKYAWFQKKGWQDEIKRMLATGLKYELDALANKDFRYLTKTYLPRKLKEKDWLDLAAGSTIGLGFLRWTDPETNEIAVVAPTGFERLCTLGFRGTLPGGPRC